MTSGEILSHECCDPGNHIKGAENQLERLSDPETARLYLEVAIEEYQKDHDKLDTLGRILNGIGFQLSISIVPSKEAGASVQTS